MLACPSGATAECGELVSSVTMQSHRITTCVTVRGLIACVVTAPPPVVRRPLAVTGRAV